MITIRKTLLAFHVVCGRLFDVILLAAGDYWQATLGIHLEPQQQPTLYSNEG